MTNVQTALEDEPNLRIFLSRPPLLGRLMAWMEPVLGGAVPPWFRKTMDKVDDRLSEHETGLGVIEGSHARFYRMQDMNRGISDVLGSTPIRVQQGPDGVPSADRADGSRPLQLLARWYGFSLTYPHCDIYNVP